MCNVQITIYWDEMTGGAVTDKASKLLLNADVSELGSVLAAKTLARDTKERYRAGVVAAISPLVR